MIKSLSFTVCAWVCLWKALGHSGVLKVALSSMLKQKWPFLSAVHAAEVEVDGALAVRVLILQEHGVSGSLNLHRSQKIFQLEYQQSGVLV